MAGDGRLKCLLLPVSSGAILLPDSLVAEIVPAQRHRQDGASDEAWYLGAVEWRGRMLPMISIEAMYDANVAAIAEKTSFVVLHRVNEEAGAEDYYAVHIDGIPHFHHVSEENLQSVKGPDRRFISHEVVVDGANAMIPDLDAVEEKLIGVIPAPAIV